MFELGKRNTENSKKTLREHKTEAFPSLSSVMFKE